MKIAVASLGNFHANPFGPELQVKQMFCGRSAQGKKLLTGNYGFHPTNNRLNSIYKVYLTIEYTMNIL
jgi:hypothetical protein